MIDVAKYITTAVIITEVVSVIEKGWKLYVFSIGCVALLVAAGVYFYKKGGTEL